MKKLLMLLSVLCILALTACSEKVEYEVFEDIERGCIEELIVEVKDVSNEGFTVVLRNNSEFGISEIAWAHFLLVDIDGVWHEVQRTAIYIDHVNIDDYDPNDPQNAVFTPNSSRETAITFSEIFGVDTMPNGTYRVGVTYTTNPNSGTPHSVSWAEFTIE